jgi:DNA helicase HerA-like ATPase
VPINEHAGAHVAELFATGNRPCLIDLGGWMVGARTRFWIDFASTLFKHTKGERWLVVDEVHNFAPKGKVKGSPTAGKALHWTNRLASEGLGKGVTMLFASQRPQKVHNDTLTSAETLIAMRVLHPSDRDRRLGLDQGLRRRELGPRSSTASRRWSAARAGSGRRRSASGPSA